MSAPQTDFEQLRDFVRHGDQQAFASVVSRHLNLVYATALRKLEDGGAADEVAQNVFGALARKAWQFAPDDSLAAWLHRTTLLETKAWLRGELRRRCRERIAAELGTTMKTPDEHPALQSLVPLLDEALLSLRERDRTALLLRFYENQSMREVGVSLRVKEDAARKRVANALEKVSRFFQRRGFKTAGAAAMVALLRQTAISASEATASGVLNAALQSSSPAMGGFTAILARVASLSKVQLTVACMAIGAAPAIWQGNEAMAARRGVAALYSEIGAARGHQDQVASETSKLRAEQTRLSALLAGAAVKRARDEEAIGRLEQLKTRMRLAALAGDYRWPEDLPLVRVPKTILGQLDIHTCYIHGAVTPSLVDLLGLSPQEKQTVEKRLAGFLNDMGRLAAQRAYEAETPVAPGMPSGVQTKTFVVPSLGEEGTAILDGLDADIDAALGGARATLLLRGLHGGMPFEGSVDEGLWRRLGRLGEPQEITVGLGREVGLVFRWGGRFYSFGPPALDLVPEPLRQLFRPWLAEIGYTNPIPSNP